MTYLILYFQLTAKLWAIPKISHKSASLGISRIHSTLCHVPCSYLLTMPSNYHYIHPERKRLIPIIKQKVPSNTEITDMTEMGTRTIRRALRNNTLYGDVVIPPKGQVGRPRAATGLDKFVCRPTLSRALAKLISLVLGVPCARKTRRDAV